MVETKRVAQWLEIQHPTIYANMMGIGMTPFDINIVFGEALKSDEVSITGVPEAKIILAPEQAMNLIKLLTVAVDTYKKTNGALRDAGAVDIQQFTGDFEASTIIKK